MVLFQFGGSRIQKCNGHVNETYFRYDTYFRLFIGYSTLNQTDLFVLLDWNMNV